MLAPMMAASASRPSAIIARSSASVMPSAAAHSGKLTEATVSPSPSTCAALVAADPPPSQTPPAGCSRSAAACVAVSAALRSIIARVASTFRRSWTRLQSRISSACSSSRERSVPRTKAASESGCGRTARPRPPRLPRGFPGRRSEETALTRRRGGGRGEERRRQRHARSGWGMEGAVGQQSKGEEGNAGGRSSK
eukprot:scaffold21005_cov30-Tisochrysis_lutea.AAC.1